MNRDIELGRLVRFYENLSPASLAADLTAIYAAHADFKDPFNQVRGLDAIRKIFVHMFEQVLSPRFVVLTRMAQGDDAFLVWEFHFRMKRSPGQQQCIRGATHVRFNASGTVDFHRDYWDAAEELYEKIPVLGALMRWLKRAANQ